jgi:predicted metal-dependent peptidase
MSKPILAVPDGLQVKRINKLRQRLCWESPVLAPALAALQIRETKTLPTAAVSARGILYVNAAFFAKKDDPETSFIIIHEVMHVLLRHHERIAGRINQVWALAIDFVINEAIPHLGIRNGFVSVPDDALWRERDAPWIPAGLTAEATYDHLMQKAEEELDKLGNEMPGGGCGVLDDEPAEATPGGLPPDGLEGLAPHEWRALANVVERGAAMAAGDVAGALKALLHQPPARVPWASLLRRLAATIASRAGRDYVTWNRRARRSPRRVMLPGTRAHETALAIVIDASGSVSDDDLSQMVVEAVAAVNATGVPAFLVCHDAAVFSAAWITPGMAHAEVAKHIGGRGGTVFHVAYDRVAAERRNFAAMVHFTDGMPCEEWPEKPVNCRMAIAAITPQGITEAVPENWRTVPVEGARRSR